MDTSSEIVVRLGFFVAAFVLFAVLEQVFPRRARTAGRLVRWTSNIGISWINQLAVRLLIPANAVYFAALCADERWGALNLMAVPFWAALPLAVLALDLAIYLQHRLFHAIPPIWRLHRMHHADIDFDVTTGIRFHPLSILLSALIKLAVIFVIGAPALAVLAFEVMLNASSIFNHSNLAVPPGLDRIMRLFVVTPDMHRVHHSSDPPETNSNFGFCFPWWDRLFATYRAQPSRGHTAMTIGLDEFRAPQERRLGRMLTQPLLDDRR